MGIVLIPMEQAQYIPISKGQRWALDTFQNMTGQNAHTEDVI